MTLPLTRDARVPASFALVAGFAAGGRFGVWWFEWLRLGRTKEDERAQP